MARRNEIHRSKQKRISVNMTKKRKEKILRTLNGFRIISQDSDCFGWSGSVRSKTAPPRIFIDGASIGAHRAAWMVENGKIPENQYIHRTCGNRMCTNPKHLFISSKRGKRLKSPETCNKRPGRERLSVDLPSIIVQGIRKMASKYNMTITRYLCKRLTEVLISESRQNKK